MHLAEGVGNFRIFYGNMCICLLFYSAFGFFTRLLDDLIIGDEQQYTCDNGTYAKDLISVAIAAEVA